mgnify:CR=1 FL=1
MANTQHSPKFALVKSYYARKLWNEYRVRMAVVHGWITAEEYEEITGQPYGEDE